MWSSHSFKRPEKLRPEGGFEPYIYIILHSARFVFLSWGRFFLYVASYTTSLFRNNSNLCDTGAVSCPANWHRKGQGSNPRLGLNFSGLSRCCLSSAKKCDDHIHSFHSSFQIQILVLSSSISTSTGLCTTHITTFSQYQHRRGQGSNSLTFSGLSRCCLGSAKKMRWSHSYFQVPPRFQIQTPYYQLISYFGPTLSGKTAYQLPAMRAVDF